MTLGRCEEQPASLLSDYDSFDEGGSVYSLLLASVHLSKTGRAAVCRLLAWYKCVPGTTIVRILVRRLDWTATPPLGSRHWLVARGST